jgi:hypothetical protein
MSFDIVTSRVWRTISVLFSFMYFIFCRTKSLENPRECVGKNSIVIFGSVHSSVDA